MLKLNEYQKTKDGDYVYPVSVSGDIVQCFDTKGESIYKNISSFEERSTSPEDVKQEKKVVEVSPVESKNTDQLHTENEDQPDDGLREEDDSGYVSDDNYI